MPVDHDFVGTGWAFPPQLTASGGIAMVRRERELEDSMRIILLTYPGERPMRPEFGCRIHDHVFGSANASTAGQIAYDVREALGGLSEECQEVLDRFFCRDESYRTIGDQLGIPSGTIASRISRCLGKLRERFG